VEPLRFRVYSDYLCPWCWNVSRRLWRLQDEYGERVHFEWRSFLLRPEKQTGRDLERFREYTKSWMGPAAEEDAGPFLVWTSDEGPPSWSLPPHLLAKAAAEISRDAFRRMHSALMGSYFAESRDITSEAWGRALWQSLKLPEAGYERIHDPELTERVFSEYREALELGATGVPAVQLEGNDAVIVGAHPETLYRRWIERSLARHEDEGTHA